LLCGCDNVVEFLVFQVANIVIISECKKKTVIKCGFALLCERKIPKNMISSIIRKQKAISESASIGS
jgi:hypothetical protein